MNPKIYLARIASVAERIFDAVRPKREYGDIEIDPYFGHATPSNIVLRGRVLSRRAIKAVEELEEDPSLWMNFKSMIALFNTREISDVQITCGTVETLSDEEGYFELTLPRPPNKSGWSLHQVRFGQDGESAELAALLPSPNAKYGIISDIDDTLIKTKFITNNHGQHKGDAIDEILAANPDLPFILLGDTGQHDAHAYYDAIQRHPGRFQQIILRTPKPDLSKSNLDWIEKIKATQTPIYIGSDYLPLLDE